MSKSLFTWPTRRGSSDYGTSWRLLIGMLQNGWTEYSAQGVPGAGYLRTRDGWVQMQGAIQAGTTTIDTLLFTLPPGCRPQIRQSSGLLGGRCTFVVAGSTANVRSIYVLRDGSVKLNQACSAGEVIDLSAILFPAFLQPGPSS